MTTTTRTTRSGRRSGAATATADPPADPPAAAPTTGRRRGAPVPAGGTKRRRAEVEDPPPATGGILTSASAPMTAAASKRAARAPPEDPAEEGGDRGARRGGGRSGARDPEPEEEDPEREREQPPRRSRSPPPRRKDHPPATPRMLASPTGRSIVSLDDATVPVPLIHGGFRADPSDPGADLENSYASVNLVRSDLVREFESRGVALARAERENASLMDALAAAEEAKTLAVAEASRWRAAKDELERRRGERGDELAAERAAAQTELESAAVRNAELESELAAANARVIALNERLAVAEASETRKSASALETGADAATGEAGKRALADARAAEAERRADRAEGALREARLEARSEALAREDLERRLEASEAALEAAEGLIGEAESAVAAAREEAERAKSRLVGSEKEVESSERSSARIAELESQLAALRHAARSDAAELARARRVSADAALVAAAEERARDEASRADRAERRAEAAEALSKTAETREAEAMQWRAALQRVPDAKTPEALADAVVRLEREVATAAGDGGDARAELAAARARADAEARRADEAEARRAETEQSQEETVAALARAERKAELLTRERDSLERVVESYSAEEARNDARASKNAADQNQNQSQTQSQTQTPGASARAAERDRALRDSRERVARLEEDLAASAAGLADARAGAAEKAAALAALESALADAVNAADAATRERDALARRLGEGAYDPRRTKVLHLRQNPESRANASWAERELEVVRGECEALRETVARLDRVKEQWEERVRAAPGGTPTNAGDDAIGGTGPGGNGAFPPPGGVLQTAFPSSAAATPGVPPTPFFAKTPAPASASLGAQTPTASARFAAMTPAGAAGPGLGGGGAHALVGSGSVLKDAELAVAKRRAADLEKLQKRYRAMFERQIWNFREAVRLVYGFRMDMAEDKTDGLTASLRSTYASSDDQILRFRLTTANREGGAGEGACEVMPTAYAETPEVARMIQTFVKDGGSAPALVANLTMENWNKREAEMRE